MKKKLLLLTLMLLILSLAFAITACNEIKTSKDYYLYTYQPTQGTFIKNSGKITFDKDNYSIYNNSGQIIDVGEFSNNNGIASFIPDKIGDTANRITATTSMYVHDRFIIETAQVINRVTDTQFEDKTDLDGRYSNNIYLRGGIIYSSIDGSDVDESFVEKIGTYKINKNKDFVIFYNDNGTTTILLQFEYIDAFGNKVCGLANRFYSYKTPKIKDISVTSMELAKKIFIKSDNNSYELSLLAYPNKNIITNDVIYKIANIDPNASINGSTLTYNGTGNVQIEYTYNSFKNIERVYIVDFTLKTTLTDTDRTFNVGSVVDYDDLISQICIYDNNWNTYESVIISNNEKAECSNSQINFKEKGTVQAELIVRHVITLLDGSKQVIEKKLAISLIIN